FAQDCFISLCGQKLPVPKCNTLNYLDGPVIPRGDDDGFEWPITWLQTTPITNLAGRILAEFRPRSRRVYILVSDDDSTVVHEENFLSLVRPFAGTRAPLVYGFAGIAGTSATGGNCFLASYGRSYTRLAAATG